MAHWTDRQTDGCVQPAAGQQAAGGYPQDPRSAAQFFGPPLPTALFGLDAFPTRSRPWPGSLRWGRFWVNSPPAGVCQLTTLFFLRTQKHILFTASYKLFTSRAEVIPLKPHGLLIPNSYLGTTFFFFAIVKPHDCQSAGKEGVRRSRLPEKRASGSSTGTERKEIALPPLFMRPCKHRNSHPPGGSWQFGWDQPRLVPLCCLSCTKDGAGADNSVSFLEETPRVSCSKRKGIRINEAISLSTIFFPPQAGVFARKEAEDLVLQL